MMQPTLPSFDCTTFTLNINDKIYHCPVSAAALYTLCREQDRSLSQLDAYLALKLKVHAAVAQKLGEGSMPHMLDVEDFIGR